MVDTVNSSISNSHAQKFSVGYQLSIPSSTSVTDVCRNVVWFWEDRFTVQWRPIKQLRAMPPPAKPHYTTCPEVLHIACPYRLNAQSHLDWLGMLERILYFEEEKKSRMLIQHMPMVTEPPGEISSEREREGNRRRKEIRRRKKYIQMPRKVNHKCMFSIYTFANTDMNRK